MWVSPIILTVVLISIIQEKIEQQDHIDPLFYCTLKYFETE